VSNLYLHCSNINEIKKKQIKNVFTNMKMYIYSESSSTTVSLQALKILKVFRKEENPIYHI
tara:strand:- start:2091 stop:2273 length:183 start_codon:yes stop_codon:yes gene_type:complete